MELEELTTFVNPIVRGWINYYGRFYPSRLVWSTVRGTSHWLGSKETTAHQSLVDTDVVAWGQTTLTNTLCHWSKTRTTLPAR